MASRTPFMLVTFLLLGSLLSVEVSAQITATQKRQVAQLQSDVSKAGQLYVAGNYRESAALIEQIQGDYAKVATGANRELTGALSPIYNQLKRAHALLELEGIRLPALKEATARPEPAPMPSEPTTPSPEPAASDGVSFSRQVAPLLVAKCGGCHVRDSKGKFGMATFADLMQGSAAGSVVFKGDASGSRLIEVIQSGDMPRGGGKITADDLNLLKTWINEGAKFDGPNPQAGLASLATAANPPADAPQVMQAADSGSVSFARELAPVLAAQCMGCHGTNRPRNNLSVLNFASLLRGGDGGPPIMPGSPGQSLLIAKLQGTADGQRMPLNSEPLSDELIAKFETWIKEGAKFDGPNANAPLSQVAALARATSATHEELSADREELAAKNWKLGLPGVMVHQAETENFLIVGNRLENSLKAIGQQAEAIAPQVADLFGAAKDQPLVKGRMTLFVFDSRYDYSEFGQMVERRRLPNEWRGHWTYTTVDAYGAIVPSRSEKYKVAPLLAQQLAGVYVSSVGTDVPTWFAEGSGRVAAERIGGDDDPRVLGWNQALPDVYAQMTAADDFLTGKLPPEAASLASYSFVRFLMADSRKYNVVLNSLREGRDFATAFTGAYGGSPAQVANRWAAKVSRRR